MGAREGCSGLGQRSTCAGARKLLKNALAQAVSLETSTQTVCAAQGCGTGLVGLGLWLLGADVTLTDQPNILPLTKHNVGETLLRAGNRGAERLRVLEYMWGTDLAPLAPPFDLVLASDVAYDHRAVSPLVSTLESVLDAPAGAASSVLLAYRCSDVLTPETLKAERKFFARLGGAFGVSEVQSSIEHVQLYSLVGRKGAGEGVG